MTIEEIRQAKGDAESRIRDLLEQLQEKTGMRLRGVEVELLHTSCSNGERGTLVHFVSIDLQI